MAKKKIKEIAAEELAEFLTENALMLDNIEFVKEGKDWFLRVTIDHPWTKDRQEERYIGTEECEKVSRFLSSRLDELDPVEQNYYLEVSSPGLDRTLRSSEDYLRFAGKQVEISLYKPLMGQKNFEGELLGIQEGAVAIRDAKGGEMLFPLPQVAKTKLKVVF